MLAPSIGLIAENYNADRAQLNGMAFAGSGQFFDSQSRKLYARTIVVVLQTNKALRRTVGVLKLADLLTVEADGNR